MHAYTVTCEGHTPEEVLRRYGSRSVFRDLEEAEAFARTYDEMHDHSRCTTRHRVFQINFVEIPREEENV